MSDELSMIQYVLLGLCLAAAILLVGLGDS